MKTKLAKFNYFLLAGLLISGSFLFFKEIRAVSYIGPEGTATESSINKETPGNTATGTEEYSTPTTPASSTAPPPFFSKSNRELLILIAITIITILLIVALLIYLFVKIKE